MPIPKPNSEEEKKDFISRCMGNETMKSEYKDNKQRLAVCYSQWKKRNEEVRMDLRRKLERRILGKKDTKIKIKEQEASTKSWASVNKSKLPASCFLWVKDPNKKSTWKLPYREGAGSIDSKTGMYKEAGPVNVNAIRAIMSALAGARTGDKMSVPAEIKKKAEALAKKYKIGKYKENMFSMRNMIVAEVFMSLRDAIHKAVVDRFGSHSYVADYSNKEVIIGYTATSPDGEVPVTTDDKFDKISYKVKNGEIEFTGTPKEVKRVTRYESRLSAEDLQELVGFEYEVRKFAEAYEESK